MQACLEPGALAPGTERNFLRQRILGFELEVMRRETIGLEEPVKLTRRLGVDSDNWNRLIRTTRWDTSSSQPSALILANG